MTKRLVCLGVIQHSQDQKTRKCVIILLEVSLSFKVNFKFKSYTDHWKSGGFYIKEL